MAVNSNSYTFLNDGASSTPAGWVASITGAAARAGNDLSAGGGTITYRRSIAPDVAASIEARVSATGVGAMLAMTIGDIANDENVRAEARLEVSGGNKVVLYDAYDAATPKGEISLEWTTADPDVRIRLKRQTIGGVPYVVLQGEVSKTGPGAAPLQWDDPADPNPDPDTATSIKVPLSSFSVQVVAFDEVEFGNGAAGAYHSFWEYVLVTEANDATTVLPYWPPAAPGGGGSIDVADSDLSVSDVARTINVDAVLPGYLSNDRVRATLNRVVYGGSPPPTDDTKSDVTDPSSGPQAWAFTNVADDQTVTATLEMIEVSGRTTQPAGGGTDCVIPDRTSPAGTITAEVGAGSGFGALSTCYNAANIPTSVAVEVEEAHIDPAASTLEIGANSQTFAALSTADQTGVPAGRVRYAWTGVDALFVTDVASYAVKATLVDLEGNPQGSPSVEVNDSFDVNKSVPSGQLVISTDIGAPDFNSFADFVPGTVYPECIVGVRIDDATWQDLDWDDGSLPAPWDSLATVGGTPETLSTGSFYDFTDPGPGTDHIIARMATLTTPSTVQFHLEDRCDNAADVPAAAASVDVDAGVPVGTIFIQEQGPPLGTYDPPAATYSPGDIKVGVDVVEPHFDANGSRLVVNEDGAAILDLAFDDPSVTPPGTLYEFPVVTLQAGRSYDVEVTLLDTAANSATVTASFVAGKPFFEIPGSQTNNPDAVTVSHTNPDNDPAQLDPSGLMLTGAANNNYIGVVVTNSGSVDGTCKYRHFMVPACLFTATANWRLITTGAPKEVTVPAGGSARSQGNVNYNAAHSEFPNPGDPLWALVSGTTLHTCTAVVLHSPDDPLELPAGGGGTAPIPDTDFDDETNFRNNVMVTLATYGGAPNGYWQAVTNNPKILNRNINIENVGA